MNNFIKNSIKKNLIFYIIIQPFLDLITGIFVSISRVNIPFPTATSLEILSMFKHKVVETFRKTKSPGCLNVKYKVSFIMVLLIVFFAGQLFTSLNVAFYLVFILVLFIKGGLNEKVS